MNVTELFLPQDRAERLRYVRRMFPECGGADCAMVGGRSEALLALARANPRAYARTRNHLQGDVTRLSPYFRHGMLSLHEAANDAILRAKNGAHKFVFELAWRDFWRRVWMEKADAIRSNLENAKVVLGNAPLPEDIREGKTGLRCMDRFVRDLVDDGYVHNHARMWFASYVIHHRKIDWRAAADWYYSELLDGDWASNHLSWQWVGSTFSAKPYFFNKENLVRYTDGALCKSCKADCPFDDTYENLEQKLFKKAPFAPQVLTNTPMKSLPADSVVGEDAARLVHDEMLGQHLPIYAHHAAQNFFIFDPHWMRAEGWSLKRVQFVCDGLLELGDVQIFKGEIAAVVAARKIKSFITQITPNTQTHAMLARSGVPFALHDAPAFARYDGKLTRFMYYWSKIERQFFPDGVGAK
jgi:deoxyribodipyrimidine photo-lyase